VLHPDTGQQVSMMLPVTDIENLNATRSYDDWMTTRNNYARLGQGIMASWPYQLNKQTGMVESHVHEDSTRGDQIMTSYYMTNRLIMALHGFVLQDYVNDNTEMQVSLAQLASGTSRMHEYRKAQLRLAGSWKLDPSVEPSAEAQDLIMELIDSLNSDDERQAQLRALLGQLGWDQTATFYIGPKGSRADLPSRAGGGGGRRIHDPDMFVYFRVLHAEDSLLESGKGKSKEELMELFSKPLTPRSERAVWEHIALSCHSELMNYPTNLSEDHATLKAHSLAVEKAETAKGQGGTNSAILSRNLHNAILYRVEEKRQLLRASTTLIQAMHAHDAAATGQSTLDWRNVAAKHYTRQ